MKKSWGMSIIRDFFAAIDRAVYGFISTIYQIILEIANVTIVSSDVIQDLYSRMYALLAIFMLFKITFSFVNYVINPDSFTDKQKGVQHLIKNVIIVLVMIILTPFAFDKLREAQKAILDDQLIPRFIVGAGGGDVGTTNMENKFAMSDACGSSMGETASDGDFLALVTLRPFFQPEENITLESDFLADYCAERTGRKPSKYLTEDIYNETSGGIYVIDYKFLLSTIVGIVVALILISFCFDIAVRSIKLAFLEMIAPIPILSYIDPASSKNGMFSKWIKQIGATWISLFIRLVAIFFAVLIISKIDMSYIKSQVVEGHTFWVMLFILIGALMFAKQLPKLFEELIPGLKLGGMQLNPFKKVADQALGGKQLLGATAATASLGVGGAAWLGSRVYNKVKNGAADKDENLEKRTMLAAQKYGDDDPRTQKLLDKWEKANTKLGDQKLRRQNFSQALTNLKGKLHIDEIALHPVTNTMKDLTKGITQAFDAAKTGYKQGSNGKFHPIEIGTNSSKERDRREKYNVIERSKDTLTDFFGIKNESGTTSMVKEDIKEQTENLRKIQSTLASMEHSFSTLQQRMGAEFANAFNYDTTSKRYVFDSSYTGRFAAEAKQFSDTIAQLDKEYAAVKKELGRLEGLQQKIKPDKK